MLRASPSALLVRSKSSSALTGSPRTPRARQTPTITARSEPMKRITAARLDAQQPHDLLGDGPEQRLQRLLLGDAHGKSEQGTLLLDQLDVLDTPNCHRGSFPCRVSRRGESLCARPARGSRRRAAAPSPGPGGPSRRAGRSASRGSRRRSRRPSTEPSASEQPRCEQRSCSAKISPPSRSSRTGVSSTTTRNGSPSVSCEASAAPVQSLGPESNTVWSGPTPLAKVRCPPR